MSPADSASPGGHPSTTPPYAAPCDSPNEVTQYRVPKVFPDMFGSILHGAFEEPARLEDAARERFSARAQMTLRHEIEEQRVVRADRFQRRRRALLEQAERNE